MPHARTQKTQNTGRKDVFENLRWERGPGDGKLSNEEYFTETYLDWSILTLSPEQFAIVYQIQIWEISLSSTDEVTEFNNTDLQI